jgi:hypothetical protein
MEVQRICFLGTRTVHFDATAAFFRMFSGWNTPKAHQGTPSFVSHQGEAITWRSSAAKRIRPSSQPKSGTPYS